MRSRSAAEAFADFMNNARFFVVLAVVVLVMRNLADIVSPTERWYWKVFAVGASAAWIWFAVTAWRAVGYWHDTLVANGVRKPS